MSIFEQQQAAHRAQHPAQQQRQQHRHKQHVQGVFGAVGNHLVEHHLRKHRRCKRQHMQHQRHQHHMQEDAPLRHHLVPEPVPAKGFLGLARRRGLCPRQQADGARPGRLEAAARHAQQLHLRGQRVQQLYALVRLARIAHAREHHRKPVFQAGHHGKCAAAPHQANPVGAGLPTLQAALAGHGQQGLLADFGLGDGVFPLQAVHAQVQAMLSANQHQALQCAVHEWGFLGWGLPCSGRAQKLADGRGAAVAAPASPAAGAASAALRRVTRPRDASSCITRSSTA